VYVLNPDTKTTRQIAPSLVFEAGKTVALATTHDGLSVLVSVASGSLYRVVQVPIDGGSAARTLLTLTTPVWYLDEAADGVIYTDQVSRAEMLLRFPPSGGTPERLTETYQQEMPVFAVLHDGRPLVFTNSGTTSRFVIVEPGGAFSPLVESNERCGPPAAVIDDRRLAVMTDKKPAEIAIVSIADGRIVARVPLQHRQVSSMAASPDGKTIFYAADGFVWSMPIAGGTARKLAPADNVAADPNGRDLIVSLAENESTRLVRVPVAGGAAQPIELKGEVRPMNILTNSAVGPDGRVVAYAASASRWSYMPAMLDPKTHTVTRIPLNFDGEVTDLAWSPGGKLTATGKVYNFAIWRFRPSVH
jgi:hypothetical protein